MHIALDKDATRQDVAIVTGPSGAGRSTAIAALEDMGFEAIDNLPLSLLERLFAGGAHHRPIAIGVDARTRDFSSAALTAAMERLTQNPQIDLSLVFLDCDNDTLLRRFSETRRRHPLSRGETVLTGIETERAMLAPLQAAADVLIDTTTLSPHDLRAEINRVFDGTGRAEMTVVVESFSFKRGTPRSADMVLDCRFLRNPHWRADLRAFTGREEPVAAYVCEDALYKPFFEKTLDMLALLLPAYKAEGKAYFTLALGCTGGKHRSVCLAEGLGNRLAQAGWQVSIRHRELEVATGAAASTGVVTS